MATLSIIILAGNESRNIEGAIASARGADEILVIDDESADDTALLAVRSGARVISRKLDSFAAQRNFALGEAQGDWAFFLDADERFSEELMAEIRRHIAEHPGRAASVMRKNFAFGRRHRFGPLKPDRATRLFPAGKVRWEGRVHERAVFEGGARPLRGHLEHRTYSDWDQYLRKQFRYADIWAREKHEAGKKSGDFTAVLRAGLGFFKMFFLNLGILGGPACWALCGYHALYTMTKYLKLAELNKVR